MTALERAAQNLLAAAVELERRVQGDDLEALDGALAQRERAFATLRAAWQGDPPRAVRALLERVMRLDARVLTEARRSREGVLQELQDLRGAGAAACALDPGAEGPRFVSRRA